MQIFRNDAATMHGPEQWFTGAVFVDALTSPTDDQHVNATNVHFAPGARTAWHTHPHGQTVWVTQGVGLVARRGGAVEIVHPGDRVFFEPGEDHWHGAAPDRLMTHLSMVEAQPGEDAANWGDQVTAPSTPPARRATAELHIHDLDRPTDQRNTRCEQRSSTLPATSSSRTCPNLRSPSRPTRSSA